MKSWFSWTPAPQKSLPQRDFIKERPPNCDPRPKRPPPIKNWDPRPHEEILVLVTPAQQNLPSQRVFIKDWTPAKKVKSSLPRPPLGKTPPIKNWDPRQIAENGFLQTPAPKWPPPDCERIWSIENSWKVSFCTTPNAEPNQEKSEKLLSMTIRSWEKTDNH